MKKGADMPEAIAREGRNKADIPATIAAIAREGRNKAGIPATIAAIATPRGRGGVAIVRVSGPRAFSISDGVFFPKNGKPFSETPPRALIYGEFRDAKGRLLDLALAARFPAPRSYTGEDCAEFHCHGGTALSASLLESLLEGGCRMAEAGEFTRRALQNGKLDLTAAEAVGELIHAEGRAEARAAARLLDGSLGRRLRGLRGELLGAAAHYAACIDYADEGVEEPDGEEAERLLIRAERELDALFADVKRGGLLREGLRAVLLGKPNVGKSSVMNRLLGRDRAIVTDVAGTTRDLLEESLDLGGLRLVLTDTAGLRGEDEAIGPVERIGVERSRESARGARLLLAVFDASAPPDARDFLVGEEARAALVQNPDARLLRLVNKCDEGEPASAGYPLPEAETLFVSAKTGAGFAQLVQKIGEMFVFEGEEGESAAVTSLRQGEAIARAREAVKEACGAGRAGYPASVVWSELENAVSALGELTGESTTDDMIDRIFRDFCVGK